MGLSTIRLQLSCLRPRCVFVEMGTTTPLRAFSASTTSLPYTARHGYATRDYSSIRAQTGMAWSGHGGTAWTRSAHA